MEISREMKKYVLVAIAGIAIAAYIVPTTGWLDLNSAFAGGNGGGGEFECEGGDGGDGGVGGTAISSISQSVSQSDPDGDEYGNTATLVNTGDANADASGGDGGSGGSCEGYGYGDEAEVELEGGDGGDGGDGGEANAAIVQSVDQSGTGPNDASVDNEGDANADASGGDGGDGGDAEVEEDD